MAQLERGDFCPLVKAKCKRLECLWYTQLRGKNPNTGADIDEWGCAVTWLPVLLVENAAQGRSTAAAVESFRNAVLAPKVLSGPEFRDTMPLPVISHG